MTYKELKNVIKVGDEVRAIEGKGNPCVKLKDDGSNTQKITRVNEDGFSINRCYHSYTADGYLEIVPRTLEIVPRTLEIVPTTNPMNKTHHILIAVALIMFSALAWNHTSTIKDKNAIDREKIHSNEKMKEAELKQDEYQARAKLNRELEADCQKQITAIRARFSNIEGGEYNRDRDYCEVSYYDTKTKEIVTGNINNLVSD